MKNRLSLISTMLISVIMLMYRVVYFDLGSDKQFKATTWDNFGYYMYLPSIFIYNDVKELEWFAEIEAEYDLTGGQLYQANRCENGNYVYKYLGGVAIMQMPFFAVAHIIAINSHYKADGFSPPYQFAMAFGSLIYCILALFLLRFILLKYFTDLTVFITLIFLTLATNLIQYTSIDSAMSHAYIFPLYVLVLYFTIKWHEKPTLLLSAGIGFVIGLATIGRPTEAIMFLIPLLWNTHNKEANREKWAMVKAHKNHLIVVMLFGIIAIAPQLIYWKIVSGHFVFNVGSKWAFFNPFFRVLFGWSTGWFIYTPITILFVLGLFFVRKYPFKNAVIVFCILNLWVIIAWFDWRYGGTYSTRALVQSYPVFALPLSALVEWINKQKWRAAMYIVGGFLVFVNIFQLYQYNNFFLHYRDMNRQYYGRIYLNPSPTPLDMSLLDTDEVIDDEAPYESTKLFELNQALFLPSDTFGLITEIDLGMKYASDSWIKVEATIKVDSGYYQSHLVCDVTSGAQVSWIKQKKFRIFSPTSRPEKDNVYTFFVKLPEMPNDAKLRLFISSTTKVSAKVSKTVVHGLIPKTLIVK